MLAGELRRDAPPEYGSVLSGVLPGVGVLNGMVLSPEGVLGGVRKPRDLDRLDDSLDGYGPHRLRLIISPACHGSMVASCGEFGVLLLSEGVSILNL